MTVRELKKLIRSIPREYNDFCITANEQELVGLITYPILSDYYDEEFNLELVTRKKVEEKNIEKATAIRKPKPKTVAPKAEEN